MLPAEPAPHLTGPGKQSYFPKDARNLTSFVSAGAHTEPSAANPSMLRTMPRSEADLIASVSMQSLIPGSGQLAADTVPPASPSSALMILRPEETGFGKQSCASAHNVARESLEAPSVAKTPEQLQPDGWQQQQTSRPIEHSFTSTSSTRVVMAPPPLPPQQVSLSQTKIVSVFPNTRVSV